MNKQDNLSKKIPINRTLELIIWTIIAMLVGLKPIIFWVSSGFRFYYGHFMDSYTEILVALLVLIFPYLFQLIYGRFPFEHMKYKRIKTNHVTTINDPYPIEIENNLVSTNTIKNQVPIEELHLLDLYLKKSEKIIDKLFSRSNAYLLIGCLIAFAGVLFFYFQSITVFEETIKVADKDFNFSKLLLEYLPRIGTLIFVEAIAFFFLRQYRQTMEEYRYYEAIKRQRENQYAIFKLANDYKDNPELFDKLINYCSFNNNPNKLVQGETNSVIEAEKMFGKETEVFDKLIELVKLAKK